MPEDIARHAVGVHALGSRACREEVLAIVLACLAASLESYTAKGFSELRQAWISRHAFQNQVVSVSGDTASLFGTCLGVDDDGALLLDTGTGLERIIAGDVSLRPVAGAAS
jgi:BirA family biotin operon repressor/biotin-[acetyl-CoA-carboxylase] ligase